MPTPHVVEVNRECGLRNWVGQAVDDIVARVRQLAEQGEKTMVVWIVQLVILEYTDQLDRLIAA